MRAIPMVAVRPGSAPMRMPRRVDQAIWNRASGVMKPAMALINRARLSINTLMLFSKDHGSDTRKRRSKTSVTAADNRVAMRTAERMPFLHRAIFMPGSHSNRTMKKNI
jgi:hypothetical protein